MKTGVKENVDTRSPCESCKKSSVVSIRQTSDCNNYLVSQGQILTSKARNRENPEQLKLLPLPLFSLAFRQRMRLLLLSEISIRWLTAHDTKVGFFRSHLEPHHFSLFFSEYGVKIRRGWFMLPLRKKEQKLPTRNMNFSFFLLSLLEIILSAVTIKLTICWRLRQTEIRETANLPFLTFSSI